MTELSDKIKNELQKLGADIVGFGDISALPDDLRGGLPVGISVAVVYPKEVIRGISVLPTKEYREWYDKLNERLDMIVSRGAEILRDLGYNAIAQTREYVGMGSFEARLLPHKTIATRAGIGWIGKCALLVTEKYGSAVRLSSILTDAPLDTAIPVNSSHCGDCTSCADACPAGAVSGKLWDTGIYRDEFFDVSKCRETAQKRALHRKAFWARVDKEWIDEARYAILAEDYFAEKSPLIGKTASVTATVTEDNTAKAAGSGSLDVFATPMMIALMEKAACECITDTLTDGQTSVGTQITAAHTAASPLGMMITATAVVESVSGKKIEFTVTATDEAGEIGKGKHTRVIVYEERFMSKVRAKK